MPPQSRFESFLECIGGVNRLSQKPEPINEPPPIVESDDELPPPVSRDPNLPNPLDMFRNRYKNAAHPLDPQNVNMSGLQKTTPADNAGSNFIFDSRKGQPAPLGINFVPFGAVAKYCYNFVPWKWSQLLATHFFDGDKIYSRHWEFYYINSEYTGVIAFVAEHQLQSLINEINDNIEEADLKINEAVVVDFEDLPQHLRPRWAGLGVNRSQYKDLLYRLGTEQAMVLHDSSDRSLETFKSKMEAALDAAKSRNKANKKRRREEAAVKRQGMVKETLRAQCYLGLLPKKEDSLISNMADLSLKEVDVNQSPPHPFHQEPIFIAIDVEAWEEAPHMVTELGIATFDTRDLRGHAPGEVGKNWHQFIRARHFLIKEYEDKVNNKYVQGCPGNFEFGESESISKSEVGQVLASCFKEPFSKRLQDQDSTASSSTAEPELESELRNIILLGHDLQQDIDYCREIGFSLFNRSNIVDALDTLKMNRAFNKDANSPSSLGAILYEFDLVGWHLHNAGNDAVYAVQAMLAICVKAASQRGTPEADKKREENAEKKLETPIEGAKEKAKEDDEGWNSVLDDDGGVPLPLHETDARSKCESGMQGGQGRGGGGGGHLLYTMGGAVLDV